jgi:S1-C subfamily serine protease
MRSIGSFGFAVFAAVVASAAAPPGSPTVSPTPLASPESITNPNTPPAAAQTSEGIVIFDVKKLAATSRPAVAQVIVLDKTGKRLKLGTGFFVSADGKLVTNAHVIAGADSASAKLENGATYTIRGVLKAALDKDLVLLQAEAKDAPFLAISRERMPDVGSRVAVIGSPFGLEGTVSEGIISGHRDAKKDDQWLQMTAPVSPGSSGSPVVDESGKVIGVATFIINYAQALNFARPVAYVSELLDQSKATTEVAPFGTVAANPKNIVFYGNFSAPPSEKKAKRKAWGKKRWPKLHRDTTPPPATANPVDSQAHQRDCAGFPKPFRSPHQAIVQSRSFFAVFPFP